MKTPRNSSNFFLASIAAIPTGGGSSTDHAKANLAMAAMEGIFLVFFFLFVVVFTACLPAYCLSEFARFFSLSPNVSR